VSTVASSFETARSRLLRMRSETLMVRSRQRVARMRARWQAPRRLEPWGPRPAPHRLRNLWSQPRAA